MSQNDLSPSSATAHVTSMAVPQAADAMIEHRYPSDIDRLRDAVGADVLPFYRDEQAILATRQASQRWPHLVAFADSRCKTSASPPASPMD